MIQHNSGSVESLDSTTGIGCSRILGNIQAGLQADINAAKALIGRLYIYIYNTHSRTFSS